MQSVLFIGQYSSGRRTLVNALLRKEVFENTYRVGSDPFVTEIISGDSERCFSVNTEYIVHECPAQANNLTFTISYLCTVQSHYDLYCLNIDQYIREILTHPCLNNDAVVYVKDVTEPFTRSDLDYIEHYLSDDLHSNLFFCINRMDVVLEKEVSIAKNYTKEKLKKVFMKNGVFDEALYQSRVFFISAYLSQSARLGKPIRTFGGYVNANVKDIDTGVPEFEYTLRKFLQKQSIEKQRAMEQQR